MLDYDAIYDDIEERFKTAFEKTGSEAYFVKPGHTEEEIAELEKAIGITIAEDYKYFMKKYEEVDLYDLYVVHDLKIYAKHIMRIKEVREEMNAPMPDNMYVIGEFDPECPIFLQDTKGKVYEFVYDYKFSKPKKYADNFIDFLNKEIERRNNLPFVE